MQKRLITGFVVVFLVLAGQDVFFDENVIPVPISEVSLLKSGFNKSFNKTTDLPTVTRVIDGDTIIVLVDGVSEKVRLIGVDTPETVDPRKPVQCFGKEASAFTRSLLLDATVRTEPDISQGNRDKYGRLLRYVFLEDGTLVNQKIIAEGYGHEYTYRTPYHYRDDFKNAERTARELKKGLWADGVCGI